MSPAAPSPVPVDVDTLRTVAHGAYYAPHDVLGPHVGGGGVTVRTLRPLAESVVVVTADLARRRTARAGRHLGRCPARHRGARLPPRGHVRRPHLRRRRPVPVPAHRAGARPPPRPRGPARAAVDRARRQRAHATPASSARSSARRSPSGPPTPAPCAWSATSTTGRARPTRCARSATAASGRSSPPTSAPAPGTSSRSSGTTARGARRPTRWPAAPRCRPRPRPSSSSRATSGPTTTWLTARGAPATRTPPR